MQSEKSQFWFNLGMSYKKSSDFSQAVSAFKKAIDIDPKFTRAYNELALSLEELGLFHEAIDYFKKAIAIDSNIPQLYNNLGSALGQVGKFKEELECYKRALFINPEYGQAWGNLGASYKSIGYHKKAIECYQKAIALVPDIAEFYLNLGLLLQEEGSLTEAKKFILKAAELKPDLPAAQNSLYHIKRQLCDWAEIESIEKKLEEIDGDDPYTSILRCESFEKNYLAAKKYSENIKNKVRDLQFYFEKKNFKKNKKIRLGYLSADFRDHPIGQMTASMFALHDRNVFEVYGYSYGQDDKSIYRKDIEKGMDKFLRIEDMENREAAEKIFEDKIDILIDLTGYTADNRLEICAMRPSPIQVSWLGFPGTSGGDFFDYFIVDKIIVPKKASIFFSEKLIYLPHCYQINNEKIKISSKKYSRRDFGLPENSFVFACFNQAYKIDSVIFKIWMNILKKVPDSVLWLWEQNKEASANLQKEATRYSIDPSRLVFTRRLPKEEHLSRIRLCDLGLDTRIYGGHTTTSDFLWAGVPVVTKLGNHFASRVCASLLNEVGLSELVTKDLNQYENMAVILAKDKNKLRQIKKKLNQEYLKTNLYNTKRFVKNLEEIYVKIWKNYLKK
jgi:predicted O-linked N-acetylglucosamine transferase (SPINDLY family)